MPLDWLGGEEVGETEASSGAGTPVLLALKALSLGPTHGYGAGQRIMQMAADPLRIERGSLYLAPYRLEERGPVKSSRGMSANNRRARFYQLGATGRKQSGVEEEHRRCLVLGDGRVLQKTEGEV